MKYLLLMLLSVSSSAQVVRQNGGVPASTAVSTLTVNGNGNSACLSIGSTFTVNCQNGRVGIGTTAPATKLHMSSGTLTVDGNTANIVITSANNIPLSVGSSGNAGIVLKQDATITGYFYHTAGKTYTNIADRNGADVISFADGGSVGIGTNGPATKLHLSSGTITVDGTGAPATGGALCLNASKAMSKCSSAVDSSGNCTCP